ncbi:hypothetical protein G4B88_003036 [Cannabis sativa]|uniref:F-box domain-containing protein n=1 Tax=Cannabis sativa TaxID=3483 RepID=A0A7J6E667_CANSA|nr:hypothetical protein G4B88_003036 [Cannabis sativa]
MVKSSFCGREMRKIRCSNNDEFFEVLYLLPTETLFQLKCVSKTWNNLISDRSFIQSKLQRTKLSISEFYFQDKFSWLNMTVTYISIDEEGFQFKQTIFDFLPKDVANPIHISTKFKLVTVEAFEIREEEENKVTHNPIHISTELKLVKVEAFEIGEEEEKVYFEREEMRKIWCLNNDVFIEVLYLLPTKTLFQLKCVSKTWNNVISDQSFIHSQLQRTKLSISEFIFQEKFLWLNKDIKIVTYISIDEEGFQFKQIIFDFLREDVVRNGSRPPHFCRSSGAILKHILQQLANNNIMEVNPKRYVDNLHELTE